MGNDDPKQLSGKDAPKPAEASDSYAQFVARLRAELDALNSQAGLIMGLDWHRMRLARIAELDSELKALGEKP
jgi:hypothetical protein